MDLKTLKAQHPQLADELLAEGRAQGVTAEHERVIAHLTMGKQAGPKGMEIAVAAIEAKEGFSIVTTAKYMAVALNQRDTRTRQDESDEAAAATNGVQPVAPAAKDLGDEIVALMDAQGGKKASNG